MVASSHRGEWGMETTRIAVNQELSPRRGDFSQYSHLVVGPEFAQGTLEKNIANWLTSCQ